MQNNHVTHNMLFLPQIEPKPPQRNHCYALSVLIYLEQKSSCSECTAYYARGLDNSPRFINILFSRISPTQKLIMTATALAYNGQRTKSWFCAVDAVIILFITG